MSWREDYRSKLTTPEGAAARLQRGDRIYLGGNAATPDVLTAAIADRADAFDPGLEARGHGVGPASSPALTVAHVLLLGKDPFKAQRERGVVRHHAFFVGPADREAVQSGQSDYVPCHLSEIPGILRAGCFPLDAAVLMVAPPDNHGFLSLGVEVLASLAAVDVAKQVIVQVNPQMPRVQGNAFVHVSQVHAVVEAEEELGIVEAAPPDEIECAIAAHIVPLVPDGATLQLGIGGIPNAVISLLEGRTDLGVHSEMISDGVMRAVERGVLSGARKTCHPRKVVTTFIMGSRDLYDWAHENARIEAHPCDYTNDLVVASSNERLVAINSAISVDLTGQINSDSIGSKVYSGVGGQVDFIRAAGRSRGGVPLIALPSTAKEGTVSRIVPQLAAGAGVVTSRADARYVVTEFGVAELWGRSLRDRALALIGIAHPRFRAELEAAAKERRLI